MTLYQFGDLLYYTSPLNLHKTRCVYVRDDAGKAVVLFMHAEFVARVNYAYLKRLTYEERLIGDAMVRTAIPCDRIRKYIRDLQMSQQQYVEESEQYKEIGKQIETIQIMLDCLPAEKF